MNASAGLLTNVDYLNRMNLTIAMTGASGSIFARELLIALEADNRVSRVHFLPSENSLRVLAEELEISGREAGLLEKLLGAPLPAKTTQLTDADIGASIPPAAATLHQA